MKKQRKDEEGMALVLATIVVTVAVVSLSALGMRAIKQSHAVDQYEIFTDTQYGLESGIASSWVDMESGGSGWIGLGTWTPNTDDDIVDLPSFDTEGIAPLTVPDSDVQYMAYINRWEANGIDDNGDGTIDDAGETGIMGMYAFAENQGVRRGVEVVFNSGTMSIWDNAIFAGDGQAGGLINGNVAIHGSVHLLGDDVLAGNPSLAAIDLSGTALIHNNYVGCPAALQAMVPALPTVNFNGEVVETLEAELRVKNGLVGVSGNSEIGYPDTVGNGVKDTMDGTYNNDGWTGNATTDDGDRGDPQPVYSDNGWDELYDMGDALPMPYLNDDYVDPVTGNTIVNPSTGVNYSHIEYFEEVLTGDVYTGNVVIHAKNNDFYYNATNPGDTNPANRQPTDDYMYFDKASNVMEINGQIMIDGSLSFSGQGNDNTIHYTGRAAILVTGDISIDTDLYSRNSDGTSALSFPVNNFLGLMAAGDMMVGGSAQLDMLGGFYSQGTTTTQRQSDIMGTLIGTYFDMGTNVPSIYQIPELSDNLPLGMIGAFPLSRLEQESWREISI